MFRRFSTFIRRGLKSKGGERSCKVFIAHGPRPTWKKLRLVSPNHSVLVACASQSASFPSAQVPYLSSTVQI